MQYIALCSSGDGGERKFFGSIGSTGCQPYQDTYCFERGDVEKEAYRVLLNEKDALEKELLDNNIWSKIYSNYHVYQELKRDEEVLNDRINELNRMHVRTDKEENELELAINERNILQGKLQLLKEYEKNPFKKFLTPPDIGETPTVGNPFAVISALSYIKKLQSDQEEYANRYHSLQMIMQKFEKRKEILEELVKLDKNNLKFKQELKDSTDKINTFIPILEIFKTTHNVYDKKIDEIKLNLRADIKREVEKYGLKVKIGG